MNVKLYCNPFYKLGTIESIKWQIRFDLYCLIQIIINSKIFKPWNLTNETCVQIYCNFEVLYKCKMKGLYIQNFILLFSFRSRKIRTGEKGWIVLPSTSNLLLNKILQLLNDTLLLHSTERWFHNIFHILKIIIYLVVSETF